MSAAKCTMITAVNPTFTFPTLLFVNSADNTVSFVKPATGIIYEYVYTSGGGYNTKTQPPNNSDMKYKDMIFTYLLGTFRQTKAIMLPIDGMYLQGENGTIVFGNK